MKTIQNLNSDLEFIQKLTDNPNLDMGMTADELKEEFDNAGMTLQTEINTEIITDLNSNFTEIVTNYATKSEVSGIVLGQIPDNTITKAKLVTSVQNQLEYAEIARLSSIYHNATKTNPQRTWMVLYSGSYIPDMTSNTQSGYTTSAVSNNSTAYGARDNNINTRWDSDSATQVKYWQIQFPEAITIGNLATYLQSGYIPTNCSLKGSNNGTDWTTLTGVNIASNSITNNTTVTNFLTPLETANSYSYYRLESTASISTVMSLGDFQVTTWAKSELGNVNLIEIPSNISALVDGMIVTMKTPTLTASIPNLLKINSTLEKWINGTLTAGTFQTLRYDLTLDRFVVVS